MLKKNERREGKRGEKRTVETLARKREELRRREACGSEA